MQPSANGRSWPSQNSSAADPGDGSTLTTRIAGTLVSACMPLPMIPPPTTSTSGEVFRASSSVRIFSKQWTADRFTDGEGTWRSHSRT